MGDPSLSPSHGEDIPYLFDYSGEKVSWGSVAGGGGMLELIAEDQDMELKGRGEDAAVGPPGVGPAARVDRKEDHLREGKRVLPIFKPGLNSSQMDSSQMNHKLDQNREIVFVIQTI